MNIHEFQGKAILRKYGAATPRGFPCQSPDEAVEVARRLGGKSWMVKAQIHAGGRSKAGGVKLAKSLSEVHRHAADMLDTTLVTPHTGPAGRVVRRLLVEQGAEIRKAFQVKLMVDRRSQRVALSACGQGGTGGTHQVLIDPGTGLKTAEADDIARRLGIPEKAIPEARDFLRNLYRAFDERDASRAEIDPLVLTTDGRVLALDASFRFDPNALFRQPEIAAMRESGDADAGELPDGGCAKFDLAGIPLYGNIGCLVNGRGLAMATLDVIKLYGGTPATFLDVGSRATAAKVAQALKPMLRNPDLQVVLVNVFGGLVRCDVIAHGVIEAARHARPGVPLVVRMQGTHEELGRTLLAQSGLPVIGAISLADAAGKAVVAAASAALRRH